MCHGHGVVKIAFEFVFVFAEGVTEGFPKGVCFRVVPGGAGNHFVGEKVAVFRMTEEETHGDGSDADRLAVVGLDVRAEVGGDVVNGAEFFGVGRIIVTAAVFVGGAFAFHVGKIKGFADRGKVFLRFGGIIAVNVGEIVVHDGFIVTVAVEESGGVDVNSEAVREEAALGAVFDDTVHTDIVQGEDIFVDTAAEGHHAGIKAQMTPEVVFVTETRAVPCFLPVEKERGVFFG